MTTATTLNIAPGQKWRTVTGRTVRILTGEGTHGYKFSAEYVGTRSGATYFTADGISIGRDDLSELLEEAPAPKVVTPAVDQYLSDSIDDELTLAALLHWQNFTRPSVITPMCWIQGTHNAHNGHTLRNGSVPMPHWRRSWAGAGELVSRCKLTIAPTDGGVAVHAETGPVFRAIYSEHPSEDHAIWFAMCKAAIAYLGAK